MPYWHTRLKTPLLSESSWPAALVKHNRWNSLGGELLARSRKKANTPFNLRDWPNIERSASGVHPVESWYLLNALRKQPPLAATNLAHMGDLLFIQSLWIIRIVWRWKIRSHNWSRTQLYDCGRYSAKFDGHLRFLWSPAIPESRFPKAAINLNK